MKSQKIQVEWEKLLERAMEEPGIAEAVDVFERAEKVLLPLWSSPPRHEETSSSADEALRPR